MQLERQLKTSECYLLDPLSAVSLPDMDVAILSVPLPWLMARSNPMIEDPKESYLRWQSLDTSNSTNIANDVAFYVDQHGKSFFEYVGEPLKLAQVLLSLSSFPGREVGASVGTAAGSEEPELYAAVIFFDKSIIDEAKCAIEAFIERHQEKMNRGQLAEVDMAIAKCKAEKYMHWIATSKPQQYE
jgi:hypothetical protein